MGVKGMDEGGMREGRERSSLFIRSRRVPRKRNDQEHVESQGAP